MKKIKRPLTRAATVFTFLIIGRKKPLVNESTWAIEGEEGGEEKELGPFFTTIT